MGHVIESIARQRGHNIVYIKASSKDAWDIDALKNADVAIEFTNPEAAYENVTYLLSHGISVVCGSTGWADGVQKIKDNFSYDAAFVQSSNFSIGVNLFFMLNEYLAKMMAAQPNYTPFIEEIHHTAKKDAPSGTAISLAEGLMSQHPQFSQWALQDETNESTLGIKALRIDAVPGTHTIHYRSPIDDISIQHTAHNRDGFAWGAVWAAEQLLGKKGCYTAREILFK